MKVRLSAEARQDLIAIGGYIARDNPRRARSFVKELTDRCASLSDMARGFGLVPRYEHKGIRRRVHANYQIFYRVGEEEIYVVRILHGAQDYDALL